MFLSAAKANRWNRRRIFISMLYDSGLLLLPSAVVAGEDGLRREALPAVARVLDNLDTVREIAAFF